MSVHLVNELDYSGMAGVSHVHSLRNGLESALEREDWALVRRLDQASIALIDKVIATNIAANIDDGSELVLALKELKYVYARIITHCKCEVNAMAH